MFDADQSLRVALAGVILVVGLGCAIAWLPARRRDRTGLPSRLLITAGLVIAIADLGGLGSVLGVVLAAMGALLAWEGQPAPEIPRPRRGGIVAAAVLSGLAALAAFEGWGPTGRVPPELRGVAALVIGATGALATLAIADRARVRLREAIRRRFAPARGRRPAAPAETAAIDAAPAEAAAIDAAPAEAAAIEAALPVDTQPDLPVVAATGEPPAAGEVAAQATAEDEPEPEAAEPAESSQPADAGPDDPAARPRTASGAEPPSRAAGAAEPRMPVRELLKDRLAVLARRRQSGPADPARETAAATPEPAAPDSAAPEPAAPEPAGPEPAAGTETSTASAPDTRDREPAAATEPSPAPEAGSADTSGEPSAPSPEPSSRWSAALGRRRRPRPRPDEPEPDPAAGSTPAATDARDHPPAPAAAPTTTPATALGAATSRDDTPEATEPAAEPATEPAAGPDTGPDAGEAAPDEPALSFRESLSRWLASLRNPRDDEPAPEPRAAETAEPAPADDSPEPVLSRNAAITPEFREALGRRLAALPDRRLTPPPAPARTTPSGTAPSGTAPSGTTPTGDDATDAPADAATRGDDATAPDDDTAPDDATTPDDAATSDDAAAPGDAGARYRRRVRLIDVPPGTPPPPPPPPV